MKTRHLDQRDVITAEAHAVYSDKDGLWHIARPVPALGPDFYWTDETYSTREEAVAALL